MIFIAYQITKENEKLSETLKKLKDDAANHISDFYKPRAPKKPTEATTKLQMKRMVEELESEIGLPQSFFFLIEYEPF